MDGAYKSGFEETRNLHHTEKELRNPFLIFFRGIGEKKERNQENFLM